MDQKSVKAVAPIIGRVACFLALSVFALSMMGSSVTICGPGCFAADLSHLWSHANPHYRPSWSADGTRIAFSHLGVIYVVEADGSRLTPVVKRDSQLEWFESPFSPAISPDGSRIACVHNSDSCKVNFDIFVSDIDGSNRRRLTDHDGTDTNPVWSPDGGRIAFMSNRESLGHQNGTGAYSHFTMNSDGSDIRKVSGADNIVQWTPLVWSADGRRLTFVTEESAEKTVSWVDPYASRRTPTPEPMVRPVSRQVVYTVGPDGSNLEKLWDGTVGSDFTPALRDELRYVSSPEEWIGGLTWSPDGRYLAFVATAYGESARLFIMNVNSSHVREIPSPREYNDHWLVPLSWSPGSSELVYWFGANWKVGGDTEFHSGTYAANVDSLSSRFLGEFPPTQMSTYWPFHPYDGGKELAVHPSKMAVYFTQSINVHSDTLLYTIDLDGSNMRALVRRDGTDVQADILTEDDYIASCAESAVPDSKNNPGLVRDCEVLLGMRDALGGGGGMLNWSSSVPMAGWDYITLRGSPPRVVALGFHSPSRMGKIYPQIGKLDALERLVLSGSGLTGRIPAQIGNLTNLRELTILETSISNYLKTPLSLEGEG